MIEPRDAWLTVLEHTKALEDITLPLHETLNHYLAEDVVADRDIPPADRSAMDGYAVRSEELRDAPCTLQCIGEVAAGSPEAPSVNPGTCVRIFTGGNIPVGADAVVMIEDTEHAAGDKVHFLKPVGDRKNIFFRGENSRAGDTLISTGTRLRPGNIGICAAVGAATPAVYRLPNVAVVATGEELLSIEAAVQPHQLRNSNGPTLATTLLHHGFPLVSSITVPDDLELIQQTISRELDHADVVITTGGVSVGKYDFIPRAVAGTGATIHYHGVAIKPGKPQLFATSTDHKPIFGLPGNPLSALVGLHEFVLPALRRLAGCPAEHCIPSWQLPIARTISFSGKRTHYALSRIVRGPAGSMVEVIPCGGSADFVAAGIAEGTVLIPSGVNQVEEGKLLEFHPWEFF